MNRTQRRVGLAVLAAALTTSVLQSGSATAAEADRGTPIGVRTTINVVAEGLDTPRGVIYDSHQHRVLVAEAGIGGPSVGQGGNCGAANGGAIYCYGETGAVFQYTEYSGGRRIVEGLPSIANYNSAGIRANVLGLHDLGLRNGRMHGVFGLSGAQLPFRDQELADDAPGALALGTAARIHLSGDVDPYGDLAAYEQVHNPHTENPGGPPIIDADPFGMDVGSYGTVVADAAGNDVLLVKPDGTIEVLAVFSNRPPAYNPADYVESVPTAVEQGPDGAFYVAELTGFAYYKNEARVWRLVPGQAPTVYASGFTNIADIVFDNRGRLHVLEMSQEGLFAGRERFGGQPHNGDTVTGRLVRVERNGTHTELASTGLENPGGVAYAGSLAGYSLFYVTNRTTSAGDTGQLLRLVVRG